MYSSPNQSKSIDKYSPSAIRGDMMKLQQQIQRVNTQFDQASQIIPENLPNNLLTIKLMQKLNLICRMKLHPSRKK